MQKNKYDFLLAGAGLFNAIVAREATRRGKRCLVVEKRGHFGGNVYCEQISGINVHKYGAHIFHTCDKEVWDYMNELCEFNHYVNSPLARYGDKIYNLPFNMNTFYQLWQTRTPGEAMKVIESQRIRNDSPANLEEQALALVGKDIYEILVKGYTEKQWGCEAGQLPAFLIRRLPVRFRYDNNYFDDPYQGIPVGGYNRIFAQCFRDCEMRYNTDFCQHREWAKEAGTTVFTGMIDRYYDYCYGALEYRSLRFENKIMNIPDYQGNAVVNYTEREIPYTRIIEHKHFEFNYRTDTTVLTLEYPQSWTPELEPYYPVNTPENEVIYSKYEQRARGEKNVYFGGRLGCFKYYNMDQVVHSALMLVKELMG